MESSSFYLDVQEIRRPESTFRLQVYWWSTVRDVKVALHALTNEPPSRQHLYHSTNPSELSNSIMLHDIGIERSGRMLRVAIDYRNEGDFAITPTKDVLLDDASKAMVENVRRGFQRNKAPTATDEFEGSGGVYFLRNAFGSYEAVFKPHDEEQGMPNNPKDRVGTGVEGLREHFQPGQGCLRELAAYIMDYKHFSGVPSTTLVHCEHPAFHYPLLHRSASAGKDKPFPKLGSLQKFIRGADLFEDLGPSLLSDFEVQKIALLDIRLLNCDRNAANILVQHKHDSGSDHESEMEHDSHEFVVSGSPNARVDFLHQSVYHLVPIDHGYCMPPRLKIFEWDWTWFNYAHVSRPVHPEIVNYMTALDINALLKRLTAQVALSDDSIFLLRLSHFLLVEAFTAKLTLKDVAVIVARTGIDENTPSRLEQAIEEAEDNAYRSIELKFSRSKALSPYFYDSPGSRSHAASGDITPCNRHKHDVDSFFPGDEKDPQQPHGGCRDNASNCSACSHALNHSPMRPQLVKSTSCNMLAPAQSSSSTPGLLGRQRHSQQIGVVPPPSSCHHLDTIVEAAARRERGLSSLSNQSCESANSSCSLPGEDLKDGGFPCSTDIDSMGRRGFTSTTNAVFQGSDEDKRENYRVGEGLKNGIVGFRKTSELSISTNGDVVVSGLDMGGMPLRALHSVDDQRTAVKTKPTISPPLANPPHSAKKQKVRDDSLDDEQHLVHLLNVSLPSPRDFGVKGWSTFPKADRPSPSTSATTSRDTSTSDTQPHPPKLTLSKSSSVSDATTTEARSWGVVSGDSTEDGSADYSYFTFVKDDDLAEGTVDCLEYCPKELSRNNPEDHLILTSDFLFDVPLPESIPLARVVSFSGFESSLMYTNQSMRTMGNLRLERRRAIAESAEFKQLRQDFAESQVISIVQRAAAAKRNGGVL